MALDERRRSCLGEDRTHVAETHGEVRWKKNREDFQDKIPCKLQENESKPPDFPRENSNKFELSINSFAMAKTAFFGKTLKTLARFSPRQDVYVKIYVCLYIIYLLYI